MTLKEGSTGREVAQAQQRLIELGYLSGMVDGVFGADTADAVYFFQHQHGFETDSILSPEQSELLASDEARPASEVAGVNDPVGKAEMQQMLAYVQLLMQEPEEDIREQTLIDALLKFGLRFLRTLWQLENDAQGDMKDALGPINENANQTFLGWLDGKTLSDRADENERRAMAALDMLEAGGTNMVRLAVNAVLLLTGEQRKQLLEPLREQLLQRAIQCREAGEFEDLVLIGETLLNEEILDEEEAREVALEMLGVAEDPSIDPEQLTDSDRRRVFIVVAGWHMQCSITHRDNNNRELARAHRDASDDLVNKARALGESSSETILQAINLDESDRSEEAVALLAPISDSDDKRHPTACWVEGMIRLRRGEYARCVEVLQRVVPLFEEQYLLATGEDATRDAAERYSKDAVNLAFAHAGLEQWSQALEVIDRTKSPRLRHSMKLRQSPAGKELLKLEARLAAAQRGVPDPDSAVVDKHADPLGTHLSSATHTLEAYRKARPDLGTARLTPPTLRQIGQALATDEAVVSLGTCYKGTMVIIVVAGDTESPSGAFVLEDLPDWATGRLMFTDEEISGWALELAAFAPIEPEPALSAFLDKADGALGRHIFAFLETHDVRRVTIVPHRLLHYIPFWALPSLAALDVRVAPSIAQWYQSLERTAVITRHATAVGNPTLDLGLASAEAESVGHMLNERGLRTDVLIGGQAEEAAIRDSVHTSGLLHFAGHGKARPTEPLLSALLTHPDRKWGWPARGDPLATLAEQVVKWNTKDGSVRYADLEAGRLVEELDEDGSVFFRRLEHTTTGTLWGRYDGGQLHQIAELWTTGDLLIEESFDACALAYLGACESGTASFRDRVDEDVGLPSALQMAGVDSVVCTLWPVGDRTALVFAGLFYRRLCALPAGEANLAELVGACRDELAGMKREVVIAMLEDTRNHLENRVARAQLEYVQQRIAEGPDMPFSHPWHWGAFFTQGVQQLALPS